MRAVRTHSSSSKTLVSSRFGARSRIPIDLGCIRLVPCARCRQHFKEYNVQLLRPLKASKTLSVPGLKKAALGFFTCTSASKLEAQVGFILFNTLTFWLGAAEGLFTFSFMGLFLTVGLSCERP